MDRFLDCRSPFPPATARFLGKGRLLSQRKNARYTRLVAHSLVVLDIIHDEISSSASRCKRSCAEPAGIYT